MSSSESSLNSVIIDLVCSFIKCVTNNDDNTVEIPHELCVSVNEDNFNELISTTRLFMFLGGLTQTLEPTYDNRARIDDHFDPCSYFNCSLKFVTHIAFPLPYPLKSFNTCKRSSVVYTALIDEFGTNLDSLNELFHPIIDTDEFVCKILQICNQVYGPNCRDINKDIRAYITRADFMFDCPATPKNDLNNMYKYCKECHYDKCLCSMSVKSAPAASNEHLHNGNTTSVPDMYPKLIEVNVVSTAISHLAGLIFKAHDTMLSEQLFSSLGIDGLRLEKVLLDKAKMHIKNDPLRSYADTIAQSQNLYIERYGTVLDRSRLSILLVVTEGLSNFFDVYAVSNDLYERYGVQVQLLAFRHLCNLMRGKKLFIAKSWTYNKDEGSLKIVDAACYKTKYSPGRLILSTKPLQANVSVPKHNFREISVIYFRSGYIPHHMEVDADAWELRLLCEFSDAVKIPTLPIQLAASKRGQMFWSDPENIDVLSSSYNSRIKGTSQSMDDLNAVKESYIPQVDPSLESNSVIVDDAIKNPPGYVLKPQREGGMGVLFLDDLSETLKKGLEDKHQLSKYVLAKRVTPPCQPAIFMRHINNTSTVVDPQNTITEMGTFGFALYDGTTCMYNESNGYLARTKPSHNTGGGLCAGYSSVNSLLFF